MLYWFVKLSHSVTSQLHEHSLLIHCYADAELLTDFFIWESFCPLIASLKLLIVYPWRERVELSTMAPTKTLETGLVGFMLFFQALGKIS